MPSYGHAPLPNQQPAVITTNHFTTGTRMLFADVGVHCSFVTKSLSNRNCSLTPVIPLPTKTEGKGRITRRRPFP